MMMRGVVVMTATDAVVDLDEVYVFVVDLIGRHDAIICHSVTTK